MRSTILTLGTALALAAPAAPAGAVRDFRLPPGPSQQEPPPDRVGPVAPDVPESRMPAPTPTPTAGRPATPAPSPTPTLVVPSEIAETPGPAPAVRSTSAVRPPEAASPAPAGTADPATASADAALPAFEPLPPASPDAASPAVSPAGEEAGGAWWLWALVSLLGLGALLGLAAWFWRRRENAPVVVPQIERPRLTPQPTAEGLPQPAFDPAASAAEPLQVTLEPLRLSLTLLNATLAYRLELVNGGPAALTGLGIGADMIAAHASMSREEQLAGPGKDAAALERIERLEPGESRIVQGEFRVPFSQIVPIRQGNAALLLPLARFRLEADGAAPVVRTFAVGQPGANAALQPFRLDQGPRVYPRLIQRAFA